MTGRLLTIAILLGIAVLGVRAWPWGIPWTGGPAARSDPGDNVPGAAIHDLTVRLGTAKEVRPTGQVREFSLIAKKATWELAPGRTVLAITYDGTVPGPTIRVTEGDTVRVMLKNDLDQETTIHFHGLHVPNGMDGVPPFTQAPIKPGETFTLMSSSAHMPALSCTIRTLIRSNKLTTAFTGSLSSTHSGPMSLNSTGIFR